ncbi:hypothetical protein CK230_15150 [Mesorhizobium sp. WSM3859]|nr:hypothetical protein CK230_15150 [Mesorhizobium sp. WSM3859]
MRLHEYCQAKADGADWPEFRDMWRTIAASYALLIGLETRGSQGTAVEVRRRPKATEPPMDQRI